MADNYVEIKIKADDTAKPDLTALRADLDELGSKVESAKVDVDDVDGRAKLLSWNAKLAALNRQVASPRITVAGAARAEAQIAALDAELHHFGDETDKADVKVGGLRSRLLALGGAAGSVAGIGDAMGVASSDASMFQRVMAGAGLATGLLEPVVAGATVGVGVLGSGLVAAGAGGGVFGLALKGVIGDVTTADQANVKLKGSLGEIQSQLNHMKTEWSRWVGSSASGVESVLAPALKLIPSLLSDATQFLEPVEGALQDVILDVKTAMDSPFWKSTISEWAATSGPMIEDIAVAIGHVIHGIAGILTTFMPMSTSLGSGLDNLTAKFAKWGETLGSHSGFQSLMETFKTETPLAMQVLKNLVVVIGHVGAAMAGISTASNSKWILQLLGPLSGLLATLSKNQVLDRAVLYFLAMADAGKKLKVAFQGISSAFTFFTALPGEISGAVSAVRDFELGSKLAAAATKIWTVAQAGLDIAMDANPIGIIIVAIAALVAAIVFLTMKSKAFRDFWIDAWKVIETAFDASRHAIAAGFDAITSAAAAAFNWVKGHWPLILGILTGPIGLATVFVVQHWREIVSGAQAMVGDVVSFFRSLPGRILGAVGDLGSLLFGAGQRVIQGLISGISSMIGSVGSAISNIAGEITSHLPFSPAKKGPLSGAGDPAISGRKIAQMLGQGMVSGLPSVTAAANRLAGGAGVTGTGHAAAGAGGGGPITLNITGSDSSVVKALVLALRREIRIQGGNVQTVLGH